MSTPEMLYQPSVQASVHSQRYANAPGASTENATCPPSRTSQGTGWDAIAGVGASGDPAPPRSEPCPCAKSPAPDGTSPDADPTSPPRDRASSTLKANAFVSAEVSSGVCSVNAQMTTSVMTSSSALAHPNARRAHPGRRSMHWEHGKVTFICPFPR